MSIKQISKVWDSSPYQGAQRLIHLALADHMNDDGKGFVAWKQLMKKSAVGKSTVHTTIRRMITDGYLIKVEESRRSKATVYQMLWPNDTKNTESPEIGPQPSISDEVQNLDPNIDNGVQSASNGVQSVRPLPSYTSLIPNLYRSPSRVSDEKIDQPAHQEYPEAKRLADLLASLITANGSRQPKVTKRWVTDIRLLHEADGAPWLQIEELIRWSQANDFWRANIQSPAKLRAKYDQLRLQSQRPNQPNAPTKMTDTLDQIARMRADEQANQPHQIGATQ